MGRIVSSKYSQKLIDHATDAFKTASKRSIRKTVEATGYSIRNKIIDKITRSSKTSLQNNLEIKEEKLREKYISPEQ